MLVRLDDLRLSAMRSHVGPIEMPTGAGCVVGPVGQTARCASRGRQWQPSAVFAMVPASTAHRTAIGLTGEPVALGSRKGAITHKNVQEPSASQIGTRSSN
jgi:hypothetical protein